MFSGGLRTSAALTVVAFVDNNDAFTWADFATSIISPLNTYSDVRGIPTYHAEHQPLYRLSLRGLRNKSRNSRACGPTLQSG